MYSRSSLHLIGKLSLVWDTVGTVHLTPRDVNMEKNLETNVALFERRRTTVNETGETGSNREIGRGIDIFA